jgi:hypothetical protein
MLIDMTKCGHYLATSSAAHITYIGRELDEAKLEKTSAAKWFYPHYIAP